MIDMREELLEALVSIGVECAGKLDGDKIRWSVGDLATDLAAELDRRQQGRLADRLVDHERRDQGVRADSYKHLGGPHQAGA